MKTISAAIAALLAIATLAPAAYSFAPSDHLDTDDARVTSITPPSVRAELASDTPLTGELDSLEGAALHRNAHLRAQVLATNPTEAALDEVVLRLDVTARPLTSRQQLADFLADPTSVDMSEVAQEPPVPDVEDESEEEQATEVGNVVDPGAADTHSEAANSHSERAADDATAAVPAGDTDNQTDVDSQIDRDADTEVDNEPPPPVGVPIGPGASTDFTLEVNGSDLELPANEWGVYGATLVLVADSTEVPVDSFPLTWGAQAVPQLDLAVLAEATGPPSRIQGVLEASDLPDVAVVVDPTHLSTGIVIGSNVDEREVFRLPLHHPDLTSLAHTDDQNLLPLALSLPDPAGVPLPQSTVASAPWLAIPAAVDSQSVALSHRHEAAGTLALPSAVGFDQIATSTRAPMARAARAPVLMPDATLSDTVTQYRPGSPVAAALAMADSALLADQLDGLPALVVLDSDWDISPGAQHTLRSLLEAPWVSSVTVSSLLEGAGPRLDMPNELGAQDDVPTEQVASLGERLDELTLLATVTEAPTAALADWGDDLLRGLSVEHRDHPAPRTLAIDRATEAADATLNALRIADSSDLNLLSESGEIPINVLNSLDHPVTVTVNLTSFSANLQVLDSPTVTIPAATDQVVLVPVEAVSTANVFVTAVISNADGETVSEAQPFSVRVRADWGNTATVIFTVVLVLLLIAGLIRTIRRGRKDTRAKPSAPPETMDGDDG